MSTRKTVSGTTSPFLPGLAQKKVAELLKTVTEVTGNIEELRLGSVCEAEKLGYSHKALKELTDVADRGSEIKEQIQGLEAVIKDLLAAKELVDGHADASKSAAANNQARLAESRLRADLQVGSGRLINAAQAPHVPTRQESIEFGDIVPETEDEASPALSRRVFSMVRRGAAADLARNSLFPMVPGGQGSPDERGAVRLRQMKAELNKARDEVERANRQIEELEKEVAQRDKKLETASRLRRDLREALEKEREVSVELDAANKDKAQRLAYRDAEVTQLTLALGEASGGLRHQAAIDQILTQLQSMQRQQDQSVQRVNGEIQELRDKLAGSEAERHKLLKQAEDYKTRSESVQQDLNRATEKFLASRESFKRISEQVSKGETLHAETLIELNQAKESKEELEARCDELTLKLHQAEEAQQLISERSTELELAQRRTSDRLLEAEEERDVANRQLKELQACNSQNLSDLEAVRAQRDKTLAQCSRLQTERDNLSVECTRVTTQRNNISVECDKAKADLTQTVNALKADTRLRQELHFELTQAKSDLSEIQGRLKSSVSESHEAMVKLKEAEAERNGLQSQLDQCNMSYGQVLGEAGQLQAQLDEARKEAEAERSGLQSQLDQCNTSYGQVLSEAGQLQAQLDEARNQVEVRDQRLATLGAFLAILVEQKPSQNLTDAWCTAAESDGLVMLASPISYRPWTLSEGCTTPLYVAAVKFGCLIDVSAPTHDVFESLCHLQHALLRHGSNSLVAWVFDKAVRSLNDLVRETDAAPIKVAAYQLISHLSLKWEHAGACKALAGINNEVQGAETLRVVCNAQSSSALHGMECCLQLNESLLLLRLDGVAGFLVADTATRWLYTVEQDALTRQGTRGRMLSLQLRGRVQEIQLTARQIAWCVDQGI